MKRLICGLLALVMVLSLAACGKPPAPDATPDDTPAPDAAPEYFVVGEGAPCCPNCRHYGDMSLSLGQEALDVLAKVKEYSPETWNSLCPSPESARQAARLIDVFVRYHLGLEWINGRFKAM